MTTQAEAIAATAQWLSQAREARERTAAAGGAQAVAEAAWVAGGPAKDQIAATYARLQEAATGARSA